MMEESYHKAAAQQGSLTSTTRFTGHMIEAAAHARSASEFPHRPIRAPRPRRNAPGQDSPTHSSPRWSSRSIAFRRESARQCHRDCSVSLSAGTRSSCRRCAVVFRHNSAASPSEDTTKSTRPSPSKSPNAAPRCALRTAFIVCRSLIGEFAANIPKHAIGFFISVRLKGLDPVVHVRIRGEKILPAVVIEIDEAHSPSRYGHC